MARTILDSDLTRSGCQTLHVPLATLLYSALQAAETLATPSVARPPVNDGDEYGEAVLFKGAETDPFVQTYWAGEPVLPPGGVMPPEPDQ